MGYRLTSRSPGGGNPERVQALLVSASTLPLLRVQPVAGRFFNAEDDTPGQSAAGRPDLWLLAAPVRRRRDRDRPTAA